MTEKRMQNMGLSALGLAVAMASGSALAASKSWTDGSGGSLMTGYGECWEGVGGTGTACMPKAAPAAKPAPKPAGPKDSDGDGVYDDKDKCPNTRAGAKVDANGCEIIPNVSLDLVNDEFDFDSAKLKPGMEVALSKLAADVLSTPGQESLTIVGHTDSMGADGYNMELSIRRAQAVADYLARVGIDRNAMTIEGKGESMPVADNATEAGRSKNRRVEIITR